MDVSTALRQVKNNDSRQFAVFRVIFGVYLLQHFLWLLPVGAELFSTAGVLSDPRLNPTHGLLPNPLATAWGGSPTGVAVTLWILVGLSLAFTLGWWRQGVALVLWYGWACLFNRNNLISNPSLPYVGLILLFCVIVPPGESLRRSGRDDRRAESWYFPAIIFWGVWFLMAGGYTFSGLIKLASPSWVDGTAFRHLLENPLARPGLIRDAFLALPDRAIAMLTWSVLVAEITFLPLACFRMGRLVAWSGMLGMHLGIVLLVDFADLSFGMVMLHLFTFDPDWLPARMRSVSAAREVADSPV